MKTWKLMAMATLVGLLSAGPCLAISGAGAIVLEFPIGARYNAMGEAGVALAQDATAAWWNPGGLAFLRDSGSNSEVQIMQSNLAAGLADDIALYWIGYAGEAGYGNLGISLTYLDMGEQTATSETPGAEPLGTFSSNMFAFGVTYGLKLTPNLGIGVGAKFFHDKLADDAILKDRQGGSASQFAVDLGAHWKVSNQLHAALAVSNIGHDIKHVDADQSDPMPRKLTAGLAYSLFNSEASGALLLVADAQVPLLKWSEINEDYGVGLGTEEVFGFGAEWSYEQSLALRIGYKDDYWGDIRDLTWGFGIDLERWTELGITFGFAQVPQAKDLEPVTRFSLGVRF